MGLPNQLNDIIQRSLKMYVAWLPVTNVYALGDYGIFSDGIFARMGNIKEFGISFDEGAGPDASLDFTSADTRVVNFAAGAEVSVIPAGAIDARITFKFNKERSLLVKLPTIKVSQMMNVNQVGNQLKKLEDWEKNWKVVYQTYNAIEPVIYSTLTAGTDITFSGEANALKALKLADASVGVSTTKELGLNIRGQSGIVALGLFKLRLIGSGINMLDAEVEYLKPSGMETDL